ncbi:glycosyltransferase family 2 protein [Candidatus Chloroploca sp. M-50]|uniref:Glycosyltransferase family 2 protein n=1 Tax=Candidatus Chloroploca mongolica TaxID=2528176 RepID=A0ABS4D6U5_9CHLR|nr:glycosyltransferase family 2 protein [Candidatus Chloroploca mongolica]MBP1465147.1 glycosyltransferase family 2 protein [Candidatus Chloroploca mongolica]
MRGRQPPTPGLRIVIVSWNVRELLQACLASIEASLAGSDLEYQIIVVDNASHDGTPAMVRTLYPQVSLLEPGRNLGFAGGNNLALRQIIASEGEHSPYILLLNPDIKVVGAAIPRLVEELVAHPELAAVGPLLRYGDQTIQSSRRRFPTRATFFWESTVLDRLWPENPWARRYRCAETPETVAQPVDWLVGAALLVRSEAIVRAGLLDERFFMYSEELEWQARLHQAWGGIRFVPDAVMIHYEGKSSEQAVAARHLNFSQSRLLLARIWYGWRWAACLRIFLRLGFAYELVSEWLKLRLGHRPELRRTRIAMYRDLLRTL